MTGSCLLKTTGYVISAISVLLLGYVSWEGAKSDPKLLTVLALGVLASIVGMGLRWLTYREKEKKPE